MNFITKKKKNNFYCCKTSSPSRFSRATLVVLSTTEEVLVTCGFPCITATCRYIYIQKYQSKILNVFHLFSLCPQLLIIRDKDVASLSSVRDLTLASCGFVSLPSSGLSASKSLSRVTVRDIKQFHYTVGLFPALETLSVEDVEVLVLDGFGPANRTLRHLTLRRVTEVRLAKAVVTATAPLRRVLFDRVNVDEIESGALDMTFVSDGENGQAAADGFTIVDSTVTINIRNFTIPINSGTG